MRRFYSPLVVAVVAAFVLGLTGCGSDGKTIEPKAPDNAKKLELKTPSGGAGAPKGGTQ